jgi:Ca2+-binding RTX toxin-like protein
VSDGTLSDEGQAVVTVTAVNDAPVANSDSFGTGIEKIYENTEYAIDVTDLLKNDIDVDGDAPLSFVSTGVLPTKGMIGTVSDNGKTFITYTYTGVGIAEGGTNTDKFTYKINDGKGGSAEGAVHLTVTGLANGSVTGTNQIDSLIGDKKGTAVTKDTILGLNGDDSLSGLGGDDVLLGGNGIDRLYGGSGKDLLQGERGDDLIEGGRDNDILNGGLGADTFLFGLLDNNVSVNTGHDRIEDFRVGVDDIVLQAGVTITNANVEGANTTLFLSNGGSVQVLDVNNLALSDWQIIA